MELSFPRIEPGTAPVPSDMSPNVAPTQAATLGFCVESRKLLTHGTASVAIATAPAPAPTHATAALLATPRLMSPASAIRPTPVAASAIPPAPPRLPLLQRSRFLRPYTRQIAVLRTIVDVTDARRPSRASPAPGHPKCTDSHPATVGADRIAAGVVAPSRSAKQVSRAHDRL
jgi:hypothetical protein